MHVNVLNVYLIQISSSQTFIIMETNTEQSLHCRKLVNEKDINIMQEHCFWYTVGSLSKSVHLCWTLSLSDLAFIAMEKELFMVWKTKHLLDMNELSVTVVAALCCLAVSFFLAVYYLIHFSCIQHYACVTLDLIYHIAHFYNITLTQLWILICHLIISQRAQCDLLMNVYTFAFLSFKLLFFASPPGIL